MLLHSFTVGILGAKSTTRNDNNRSLIDEWVQIVMEKLKNKLFVLTSLLFPSSVSVLLWEFDSFGVLGWAQVYVKISSFLSV